MADNMCDRCGTYLPDGSMRYTVHIQILSDFDGFILVKDDELAGEIQSMLDTKDEADVTDEIFQELSFTLCVSCKKRFARDPFNRGHSPFKAYRNKEHLFH